jgi:hypothetical protein
MHRHSTTATPELQRDLKQNFEAALGELRQDDPKAIDPKIIDPKIIDPKIIARRKPIVQRQRFSQPLDPKNQALTVASTALSALWGL